VPFELINTLATLFTASVIAATAIAALIQLRHLRASNQINAMLAIGEKLDGVEFQRTGDFIRHDLKAATDEPAFIRHVIAFVRREAPAEENPHYDRLFRAIRQVANAFEELGILLKRGIIDQDIFLERYAFVILGHWERLAPIIAFIREVTGSNALWENFEYLTTLAEKWNKEYPTSYPPGAPRMQLTNPWPIERSPEEEAEVRT
jgi:hypothetical protein